MALDAAGVTIDSLLHEVGVGELVQGDHGEMALPVGLEAQNGSKPGTGRYRSPPGAFPIMSLQVNAQGGAMSFEIDVQRATIQAPGACLRGSSAALLSTSFQLVGGSETPVWVHGTAKWNCNGAQLATP